MDSINNRKNKRYEKIQPAVYRYWNSDYYYGIKICNRSDDGLYFETDYPMAPGEQIFIISENSIANPGSGAKQGKRAHVVWCREIRNPNDDFGVGVAFRQ